MAVLGVDSGACTPSSFISSRIRGNIFMVLLRWECVRTRAVWAVLAGLLLVLSSNSVLLLAGTATASDDGNHSRIPHGILAYLSTAPGPRGCIEGTVSPFTISSVACPKGNDIALQNAYHLDCSSTCSAGTLNTASNNFAGFAGYSTVPSNNPTTLYSYPQASVSYWIGLKHFIPPYSGTQYLLQAGIAYAIDINHDSHHPAMFAEFYSSSGICSSSFCGAITSVSPGDSMYFEIEYKSGSCSGGASCWLLYSQDSSTYPWTYSTYYVYIGSGNGQIPDTSEPYAFATTEGQQSTSSSYFPSGTLTFHDMLGFDANGNYQIGTSQFYTGPSGTSITATLGESQYSCNWVGKQTTCQSTSIAIS